MTPTHPKDILKHEFMKPLGITVYQLADDIKVSRPLVYSLLDGRRRFTANIALRLAAYFGTSPEFWMNLQTSYELEKARKYIPKIKPVLAGK